MTNEELRKANETCVGVERHGVEICRDLRRLAGIVNKYGWELHPVTGEEPVGGVVLLSGPGLIYQPRLLLTPGYFTREEIDKAVEIMYGENPARP